jgi:two-component sensor histidine kinase
MQADSSKNNKLKDKLQTSMDRVFSMALVHEQLYASETNEYIDAREYLHEIVSAVMASQKNMAKEVAINLSIDEVKLPLNIALPLGMILNELISNAFKYAFKTTQKGLLKLSLKQKDDAIIIFISDNGPGMDTTNKREKSIGLQIANDFMYQLKGTLKTFNNNGTNYELYIPLFSNKK